jgi:hypothetical protein
MEINMVSSPSAITIPQTRAKLANELFFLIFLMHYYRSLTGFSTIFSKETAICPLFQKNVFPICMIAVL